MMIRRDRNVAHLTVLHLSPEFRDLIRRRTIPFLDSAGLDRPLSFVLEEVYLQGLRDAADAMGLR